MRKVVMTQNQRASGRLFELGSLLVYEEETPIFVGFKFEKADVVGYARRMKLDIQSGEVSMEINFKPGFSWDEELEKLYDFTIYADQVEARGSAHLNTQIISKCRLRAVCLVPIASMPIKGEKKR